MKYAIVGTGSRHSMYREALTETFTENNELVALCDINAGRLALSASKVRGQGGNGIATYDAVDFGRMIREQRPDKIIITTPDYLHDTYIVEALRAGCDVITEKPMTTDLPKLKAILDAQLETGKSVTVAFNYRYNPAHSQIKELLTAGTIGAITAVDFRWSLDRVHGADYFRRWHRDKEKSGGLLVHKATHHFDLVNWWIDSHPLAVSASGKRVFYTPATAEELSLQDRGERCHGCPAFDRCEYRLDLANDESLRALYLDVENDGGYLRDRCVFAEDISIEDTMQVQVRYANEVFLNYTLCAYSPWEGYEIVFHGTKGELRHRHVGVHGVFGGERHHGGKEDTSTELHLANGLPKKLNVWFGKGDHGGADPVMLSHLIGPPIHDKYDRGSSHRQGAWSILTGIAANQSIETGLTVSVPELMREAEIHL